jgi:hypothetical protein
VYTSFLFLVPRFQETIRQGLQQGGGGAGSKQQGPGKGGGAGKYSVHKNKVSLVLCKGLPKKEMWQGQHKIEDVAGAI